MVYTLLKSNNQKTMNTSEKAKLTINEQLVSKHNSVTYKELPEIQQAVYLEEIYKSSLGNTTFQKTLDKIGVEMSLSDYIDFLRIELRVKSNLIY